jgi:hypothetical protein
MSRKRGRCKQPTPAPADNATAQWEPISGPLLKKLGRGHDIPEAALRAFRVFTVDKRFVASRELLLRACGRVTPADARLYVPHDPGVLGYIAAYEDILQRGEAALSPKFDDRWFSLTETIALTRWRDAPTQHEPPRFRWFRILTCAVEVLLDDYKDWQSQRARRAARGFLRAGARRGRHRTARPSLGGGQGGRSLSLTPRSIWTPSAHSPSCCSPGWTASTPPSRDALRNPRSTLPTVVGAPSSVFRVMGRSTARASGDVALASRGIERDDAPSARDSAVELRRWHTGP